MTADTPKLETNAFLLGGDLLLLPQSASRSGQSN